MKSLYLGLFLSLFTIGCKGPAGAPGAPGAGKIVSTLSCTGTIGNNFPELEGIEVEYDAVLTSGGDIYATAVVVDQVYNRIQASGTAFYAANQNGAQTALVLVSADAVGSSVPHDGLWAISLDRSTLVTSIRYTDSDSPTRNMTFAPNRCTVQYF